MAVIDFPHDFFISFLSKDQVAVGIALIDCEKEKKSQKERYLSNHLP